MSQKPITQKPVAQTQKPAKASLETIHEVPQDQPEQSQPRDQASVGSVAYFEYLLNAFPNEKDIFFQGTEISDESSIGCPGCETGCDAETPHIDEETGCFHKTCELNSNNCLWCGTSCGEYDYCDSSCAIAEKRADDAAGYY